MSGSAWTVLAAAIFGGVLGSALVYLTRALYRGRHR